MYCKDTLGVRQFVHSGEIMTNKLKMVSIRVCLSPFLMWV